MQSRPYANCIVRLHTAEHGSQILQWERQREQAALVLPPEGGEDEVVDCDEENDVDVNLGEWW